MSSVFITLTKITTERSHTVSLRWNIQFYSEGTDYNKFVGEGATLSGFKELSKTPSIS